MCTAVACVTITEPDEALSVNIVGTDVQCNGDTTGAADLIVNDGTPPYSYSWDSGQTSQDLSNISGGVYCVTVTDENLCTVTACVTITEPVLLTINIDSTQNVTWNGGDDGAVELTVSGGTPGYSYEWNTGPTTEDLNNIQAGTYCVTVTDTNLCTITACVTITEPEEALTANIVGTNVQCNGENNGAANLIVSGGTTPYTYFWNP